jgi:hypothetical protein
VVGRRDDADRPQCQTQSQSMAAAPVLHTDFVRGNIMEVELKNFMTHEHCVLRPSSRLNLVLGPSGAGKSSFVAAIYLAFGGDIKDLLRASKIDDFIRRGAAKAHIRVRHGAVSRAPPHARCLDAGGPWPHPARFFFDLSGHCPRRLPGTPARAESCAPM